MKKKVKILVSALFIIVFFSLIFLLVNRPISKINQEEIQVQTDLQWAYANNGMPEGWVSWDDEINGIKVIKKGPVRSEKSFIISNVSASIVGTMPFHHCLGDSESATCYMGEDPQVLRYWKTINYYY